MPYKKENRKQYYERHKKYYDAEFKKLHKDEWNKYQREYKKAYNKIKHVKKCVNELNIDEEGTITYKAAIIFFCLMVGFNKYEAQKWTKYNEDEVDLFIDNWKKCGIYKDGYFIMDSDFNDENPLHYVIQISLIAMAGTGEVIRRDEYLMEKFF